MLGRHIIAIMLGIPKSLVWVTFQLVRRIKEVACFLNLLHGRRGWRKIEGRRIWIGDKAPPK